MEQTASLFGLKLEIGPCRIEARPESIVVRGPFVFILNVREEFPRVCGPSDVFLAKSIDVSRRRRVNEFNIVLFTVDSVAILNDPVNRAEVVIGVLKGEIVTEQNDGILFGHRVFLIILR